MSYNDNSASEGGNIWSSGSRGGSRGGYSRSNQDDDDNGARGGGSYHGSFGNNNNSRRGGGGYGFRRQDNNGEVEILNDAIFIQNLPKNITRDEIIDAFSTVGPIKTDDRSGGPKVWIYKDRDTGESNGRATVTYEDDETAGKAVSEYNDQHIESIGATVRVQLAQRRTRTDNDRGGRSGGGGYRGGRSNWDSSNSSRQGFNSNNSGWGSSGGGFSDNRSGGFRGGKSGDSYRDSGDQGGYRGNRSGPYRGASRGNGGSSNYSPY